MGKEGTPLCFKNWGKYSCWRLLLRLLFKIQTPYDKKNKREIAKDYYAKKLQSKVVCIADNGRPAGFIVKRQVYLIVVKLMFTYRTW